MPSGTSIATATVAGVSKATPPTSIDMTEGESIWSPSAESTASNPEAFQNRVVVRTRLSWGDSMKILTFTVLPLSSSE